MMHLITLNNIHKTYGTGEGKVIALDNISFNIEEGSIIAIMGKSGSGKSTLLNILAGLDIPDSGEYYYEDKLLVTKNGDYMTRFRRDTIGFIVQHFALINDYNVFQNIALPLRYKHIRGSEIKNRVLEIVKKLEISDKLKKRPTQLSGGQAQRVAISRALINNSKIILADEPTGALDSETGDLIMKIFESLHKEGYTIIIVTHDSNIAARCEKIVYLKDGNIVESCLI